MTLYFWLIFLIGLLGETVVMSDSDGQCTYTDCTFDNDLCGWTQIPTSVLQWKRHSDDTPTSYTGPSKDHTSGNGDYIYAILNIDETKQASLISPHLVGGTYCLSVWYQLSGNNMQLGVLKRDSDTFFGYLNSNVTMWQNSLIEVRSEGNFQIDIQATYEWTNKPYRGVIAIDDVSVSKTMCPLDCSFDSGLCAWRNDYDSPWTWSKDYNSPDHYLLIANNNHTASRKAELQSSRQDPGLKCLSLHFHVAGIKDNSLSVVLKRNNEDECIHTVLNKMVEVAKVKINSSLFYQVVLVGEVQAGNGEDIYIETIASVSGSCPIDCNSNPCLNGAACEQSNTDGNYKCVCSAGWTGQHCGDIVSTTVALSTAGTESSTSNESTQSQNEQGEILKDSYSTSYIVIPSAGVVFLFIVGTVASLLILRRNRQRKRRLGITKDRQRQQDNTNEINDTYAYELSESMYEQAGAENTDDLIKPKSPNEDNENEYEEAQYMHSDNVPDIKAEENVYNHLTQAKVEPIVDQTYSHIPDVRYYPKSAGEKQQSYLNVETQVELHGNDKNNLDEDTIYNALETSINSKPRSETMELAHEHDEYDHIGFKQW